VKASENTAWAYSVSKEKKKFLFFFFLVIMNIVEVITSIQTDSGSGLTLGQLIKTILFFVYLLIALKMMRNYPELIVFLWLGVYLFVVEVINFWYYSRPDWLIGGVSGIIKHIMPFLMYYSWIWMADQKWFDHNTYKKGFLFYSFGFSILFYLPVFLGISKENYSGGGGFQGWYNAGNEIGTFLVIVVPLVLCWFLKEANKRTTGILLFLLLLIGVLTGAKAPLGVMLFSFLLIPAVVSRHPIQGLLFVVVMISLGFSLVFLNFNFILSMLPGEIYGRMLYRISQSVDAFDFLFGIRLNFLNLYMEYWKQANWFELLFGSGIKGAMRVTWPVFLEYRTAELDLIDLMARYGLVGFLGFCSIIGTVIFRSYSSLGYSKSVVIMLLLLCGNGIMAGHTLGNAFPTVVLTLALAVNTLQKRNLKEG
jgi:hypothetical protein